MTKEKGRRKNGGRSVREGMKLQTETEEERESRKEKLRKEGKKTRKLKRRKREEEGQEEKEPMRNLSCKKGLN